MRLEEKIEQLDQALEAGQDPPEGHAWGDGRIETEPGGGRVQKREFCILKESLKPGTEDQYGVYVIPDATGLARFRSHPG